MAINFQGIEHVAELARLRLSAEEKERFSTQFQSILAYIDQLQDLDTKKIEPTAQVSGLIDVWRNDEVKPWNQEEVEAALQQGEREGGYIKVKRVL